eukprot:6186650-Pleurochrysis_carterae.AAC.1
MAAVAAGAPKRLRHSSPSRVKTSMMSKAQLHLADRLEMAAREPDTSSAAAQRARTTRKQSSEDGNTWTRRLSAACYA